MTKERKMKITWKTIRNEDKEIVRRELTSDIYIERRCYGSLKSDYYNNVLVINGKDSVDTDMGYTLKELKEKGIKALTK